VVVGGGPAVALFESLREGSAALHYEVFHEPRTQASDFLRRKLHGARGPCAILFKASRAEMLETIAQDLQKAYAGLF
jgi:hypothetical protein